ncbi:exportin-1 [Monosporozyma unispora]
MEVKAGFWIKMNRAYKNIDNPLIMEGILQFDKPLDIPLLDQVVNTFYSGQGEQQQLAGEVLTQFQSHPKAWMQADRILEFSTHIQSKFIALSILEQLITTKWNSLPQEQRVGILNFIIGMILTLSKAESRNAQRTNELIQKADLILVQILKKDWNDTFIRDLINSSYVSNSICSNNLYILRLMSEEIFDDELGQESLTQAKRFKLRKSLSQDFEQILLLCYNILSGTNMEEPKTLPLCKSTLTTLNKYLDWIPIKYIFDSNIIPILIDQYLIQSQTRSITLKCLTTIVNFHENTDSIVNFQELIIQYFQSILSIVNNNILSTTSTLNLNEIYIQSTSEDQLFLQDWEIFLCTFLTRHRSTLENLITPETPQFKELLLLSHQYILQLTKINDQEMFKVALDYWHDLVAALFIEIEHFPFDQLSPFLPDVSLGTGAINPLILKKFPLKRNLYTEICSQLRFLIIDHMVKPEEVQITMTEDGEFIKEVFTETDNIQLYETEREVIVLLTHLDVDDMESILWNRLLQLKEQNMLFNKNGEYFNKICWAIGAISGTMRVELEQHFLTRILALFWELSSSLPMNKEETIIYSSNVMFVVGQYPRFLKNHWHFFHKFMFQLFEMMHNENDAIREMACDTFLKITKKCKYQMATVQDADLDKKPFIRKILENMDTILSDLTSSQLNVFYQACALIITQERDFPTLRDLTVTLMKRENNTWQRIISQFRINSTFFQNNDNCQQLIQVLRANHAVSNAMSYDYFEQMQFIYLDMLDIYKNVSIVINNEVLKRGEIAAKIPTVRVYRIIKRGILRLMQDFISNTRNYTIIIDDIVPSLFKVTLEDYQNCIPELKEFELLKCLTIILDKCGNRLITQVEQFFPYVFEPTLNMINKDLVSFPEHRLEFYKLLNAINKNCFQIFLDLPIINFKLFFDSICWALKHTNREIESLGIDTALIMMRNIDTRYRDSEVSKVFFQEYYLVFINETFYVLTEPDHKATFSEQALLLMRLINLSISDVIPVPIYGKMDAPEGTTNREYLMTYMVNLLLGAFSNLTRNQVETFLTVLVGQIGDTHHAQATLRDFLVQIREIGGDPTDYLFAEERENEIEAKRQAQQERASKIAGLSRNNDIMA